MIQAESEVERLDQLKASKMKELFFKKQIELQDICKKSHMEVPSQSDMENIMKLIISGGPLASNFFNDSRILDGTFSNPKNSYALPEGEMDHSDLLMCMEEHISKAKEEACSRKDIMEKVEKWMASCEEERWLEEYSMVISNPSKYIPVQHYPGYTKLSYHVILISNCLQDENRYSVSRGAHKNLKRAERARIIVNKIPGKNRS